HLLLFDKNKGKVSSIMSTVRAFSLHHRLTALYSFTFSFFKDMTKTVPLPSVLSTPISPPCNSTISLAIVSPRPDPPLTRHLDFSERYIRSNIDHIFSYEIHYHVSEIVVNISFLFLITSIVI